MHHTLFIFMVWFFNYFFLFFFFFFLILKIWMSAPMEPTSVAHMLTARTRWALTAACVKKVILGMASLAQVSFLRRQCWMTSCGPL